MPWQCENCLKLEHSGADGNVVNSSKQVLIHSCKKPQRPPNSSSVSADYGLWSAGRRRGERISLEGFLDPISLTRG